MTVTHEYRWGRRIRSREVREPEWDEYESQLMLAYLTWTQQLDPNGIPIDEATSADADPNNYGGGYRYIAIGPNTNWAEKARLDAIDAWKRAAGDNPNLNGLYWRVERVDE